MIVPYPEHVDKQQRTGGIPLSLKVRGNCTQNIPPPYAEVFFPLAHIPCSVQFGGNGAWWLKKTMSGVRRGARKQTHETRERKSPPGVAGSPRSQPSPAGNWL